MYSLLAMALLAASTLVARSLARFEASASTLSNPQAVPLVIAFVVLSLAGGFAYYLALREPGSKTAAVAAVVALNIAIVAVASWALFRENLSTVQLAGLALAFVSVIMLSAGG